MIMKNNGTIRFSMAILLVCGCVFLPVDLVAAEKSKETSSTVQKNDTAKKSKATESVMSKEELEKLTTKVMEKSGNPLMQAGAKWLGWVDKIKKVNALVWGGIQASLATNEKEFLQAWETAIVDVFGEGIRKNQWVMEQIRKIGKEIWKWHLESDKKLKENNKEDYERSQKFLQGLLNLGR